METTFDANTGDHVLTFKESVPIWYVMRNWLIYPVLVGGILVSVVVWVSWSAIVAILIGAGCAWIIWKHGGIISEFTSKVTINELSGQMRIDSGYRASKGWAPHVFNVQEVATLERKNLAAEDPALLASLQQEKSSTARHVHSYEVVSITFNTGEQIDLGWQDKPNDAAILQTRVRELIGEVKARLQEATRAEQRRASLAPGDEPL